MSFWHWIADLSLLGKLALVAFVLFVLWAIK